ncbi:molecular chaperone HtpG [Paludicola sp. MB14-C6]|uniref:molecular chaperone HtpG n=1 Tax=Paludihabitans sp. MB14-C6 TaxID=3070656 RepID=UPI0027DD3A41|nr:molecular chaperone HtpG [Paludicola sp. MB14-C6]WMJ22759.1 molecular chaperone HtpG [Paludicola sp. MB14-C6]
MAKKQFKAESKRLLDLMIHSIYTNQEIFLRELISNASDAMDKLCYLSLTNDKVSVNREELAIRIIPNKENNTLTVSDNGIGMDQKALEDNLGVIARSGSLQFKNDMSETEIKPEDIDIIGQFGVGFYSAFMVSESVAVITKPYGSDIAYKWESTGADGYTITECEKDTVGTDIIMTLKKDTEDENYSRFLNDYTLRNLVKKYSDYIRYPIKMDVEKSRPVENKDKDDEPKYETYIENETLNDMVPIWHKQKSEVTDEQYNQFYKDKFFDYEDPIKTIHISTEGVISYEALLFIPSKTPYNYFTKEYEKGLQLYSSGVLIMDKCSDLIPEHFRFVRGVVDSQDLSLNISREMLQQNRQLQVIASSIEKKIKRELSKMLENDREKYQEFFKHFGIQLKYGVVSEYGAHKDNLKDLLLFYSSTEQKPVTLAEYISRMKEEQKYIYYACGETITKIDHLPQTEAIKDKDYEILYLTDEVDDFVMNILHEVEGKELKSVNSDDVVDKEDREAAQEQTKENKDLFDFMKESLAGKVKEVRISEKLKSHPVCLSSEGNISLEMEKYFAQMQSDQHMKAERVLELNAQHPIFNMLKDAYENDKERANKISEMLYNQAMLIAGFSVEDPTAYTDLLCELLSK